jgi:transcriptional regulator with XRE-family HTH domain
VDDQRVGSAFRAVRIRRGWTQAELAQRCAVSASLISLIERGHMDTLSLRMLRRIAGELEIRLDLHARMRTGDIDRILNAGHAAMHEALARYLGSLPDWLHAPEVSFAVFRDRGVIDILAFHPPIGALLVIELKTELVSLEDLLGTMDVRMRLAERIGAERGWRPRTVSCWVVLADTTPNRRRTQTYAATLRSAFPSDGREMRRWMRRPSGALRAVLLDYLEPGWR